MPVINSSFSPSFLVRSRHLQTIIPALIRPRRCGNNVIRHRLELNDGDFLDVDCQRSGNKKAAIITHGLEGSSSSQYVRGVCKQLQKAGYDCFAWNMRGCSGEINRLLPSYHSGFTEDLRRVIAFVENDLGYSLLTLVGFSVGGNITLKYLGEDPQGVSSAVKAAVAVSVPTDLSSSAAQLALRQNTLYMGVFLRSLFDKLQKKKDRFPAEIDLQGIEKISTFAQYDKRFIAPLFGFTSAEDYWSKASSLPFLASIRTPTLLLNSLDDSFLGDRSFPISIAKESEHLHLEITPYGGHVGFMYSTPWGAYYSEKRAVEFLSEWL